MARDPLAIAETFAASLQAQLGENLVSFCLYGPAVRHDTRDGDKALTTLLILDSVAPAALRPIQEPVAGWARKGHPAPLVFSHAGWKASADVFPIEIEDMREAHRLLLGIDPFEGITTTSVDLRNQLEREARGKLLRLRMEFVAAAPRGKELEELLLDSIGTFFVLFRAVHRLAGRTPPQTPKALVSETAEVAHLEASAFDWVLDKLVGHNVPSLKPHDPIGDRYLEQIERLVQFIDQYDLGRAAAPSRQEDTV